MNVKIEFRYAVLTSLLMLLFLLIEFMAGLQDEYIKWHPYISLLATIAVPTITYRLALIEKIEEKFNKIDFKQAFICGLLLTVFSCILLVPLLMGYFKLVNPDFFQTLILYTTKTSKVTMEQAAQYINLNTYIAESVVERFITGTVISIILAFRMRTV